MTLGLCMIVKNESQVLERVLTSATKFANEIVIVDTGSTDNTKEIAKKFTDKIYDFEWIDDFSAARNFALSQIKSDYWIWLDADDIVPQKTADGIAEFMKNTDGTIDVVMLPYIINMTADGKPLFSYYRERIIKNNSDFYWQGCVHEVIQPKGNIVNLDFPIVHDKPKGRKNGTRNLDIYRKNIADGLILSARERYYYARELYYNGFITDAINEFNNFINMEDGFYINKIDACIMLAHCYLQIEDIKLALTSAFSSFVYGLPTGEACCVIGEIYRMRNDYNKAIYWYECATNLQPDLNSGAFIDYSSYRIVPYIWLTVCYDKLSKYEKAYYYHKLAFKNDPLNPSVIINQKYFEKLGYVKK